MKNHAFHDKGTASKPINFLGSFLARAHKIVVDKVKLMAKIKECGL